MHPLLFQVGDLRFHAYPAALATAFLVCTLLSAREGDRLPRPVFIPPQGAVWTLLGALVGARAYYILQYQSPERILEAIYIWRGGYVFYGGFIGAFFTSMIYGYATRVMDWRIPDVIAPYLALGQAIGRSGGCYLNGCCWGGVCEMPWAVQFPKYRHAYEQHVREGLIDRTAEFSLPVHPTQLYAAIGLVCICLFLRYRLKNAPFRFAISLQYVFLYGCLRFGVEIFRADGIRSVFGMTVSQAVALAMIFVAPILYFWLNGREGNKWPFRAKADEEGAQTESLSSVMP